MRADTTEHELVVFPDPEAVARHGAAIIAERARAAVADNGSCSLAVSGGRTPWVAFAHLRNEEVPWEEVTLFQVDERIAPDGDPDRNLTHLLESLPEAALARLRPLPVADADPNAGAITYASMLPRHFDLIHLGLGDDGHTASLVPGDPALDVTDQDVAITGEYMGRRRMTLTYPVLNAAHEILWLVTGAEKTEPLGRLLANDTSIPAGRVRPARSLVFADEAAAGRPA
jgi:6-phosphogluconolactonase